MQMVIDSYWDYTNALFSKYGFSDGYGKNANLIHQKLSDYLKNHGFENERLVGGHNNRVYSIKIDQQWYDTDLLSTGPPHWKLWIKSEKAEDDKEFEVPPKLADTIIKFIDENKDLFEPHFQELQDEYDKKAVKLVVVFKKEISDEQAERVLATMGFPFYSGMDSSKGKTYFYNTGPKFIIGFPAQENIQEVMNKYQSLPEVYEVYQPDWTIQKD